MRWEKSGLQAGDKVVYNQLIVVMLPDLAGTPRNRQLEQEGRLQ